ncbi:MAG: hypothetical protein B6242_10585 [Anaerolineaceae bacterium 4572_78]|nr:MAG: hypothetical protein B6242_10585 [Anaerolineaceae bacterium 4572_78]
MIGALVADEVRKIVMPLADDTTPAGDIHYDLTHPRRFDINNKAQKFDFAPCNCLMVGAGALGTYAGLALTVSKSIRKLTIVDPDIVEETNLNRQILFYDDAVGKPKAPELAAKLAMLSTDVDIDSIVSHVTMEHVRGVDMILSCVDNFEARAYLNHLVGQFDIPLISGGSSAFGGDLAVYCPGKTSCLDCYYGVNELAQNELNTRASCADVPEASIVTTNQLIGTLMVGETRQVFHKPLVGVIEYDTFHADRLGIRSMRSPCQCHLKL